METESKEMLEKLADLTGCIVGSIIASPQLKSPRKEHVEAKGEEALKALQKLGYSFKKEEVDYSNPGLPTYLVTHIASKRAIIRMSDVNAPATKWYYLFTA